MDYALILYCSLMAAFALAVASGIVTAFKAIISGKSSALSKKDAEDLLGRSFNPAFITFAAIMVFFAIIALFFGDFTDNEHQIRGAVIFAMMCAYLGLFAMYLYLRHCIRNSKNKTSDGDKE